MKRREFITLLGGAAVAWPLAARAQQRERVRRVGVLINLAAADPEVQARVGAFLQGLQEFGWAIGRNLRIESRFSDDNAKVPGYAEELVALAPDVIMANSNVCVEALQRASRAVPIVFAASTEPVGSGLVESLARPGGNTTGFVSAEFGTSAKWLELLKEITPAVTRVAFLHDPGSGSAPQFAAIQAVAGSFGVTLISLTAREPGEMERAITAFARGPTDGLIVSRSAPELIHRSLIATLAARHRLPAVYPLRPFVTAGGLMSYGPDIVDQYRRAAGYVDRILKGAKPADLPVQAPNKFELVINLKTATALGLEVPPTLLARADEVIE